MKEKQPTYKVAVHQGKNLACFRKMKHITQEEFAKMVGHPRTTIANWEQEEVLKDEVIDKCARILNIDPYYIKEASAEEVFSKFTYSNIKLVAEDKIGLIAENGSNVETEVFVTEEGVEYHENPLKQLIESHEKEINRLLSQIEKLETRIGELEEARYQELLKRVRQLEEEKK